MWLQDRSFFYFRQNDSQTREERENVISYVKVNMTFSITILFIVMFSNETTCTESIKPWLLFYPVFMFLSSLTKLASLQRSQMNNGIKWFFRVFELTLAISQIVWIIYGNVVFLNESKICIQNSPLLTFTFLFVLILGFLELSKFVFLFVCIIIWSIAMCLCMNLTLH